MIPILIVSVLLAAAPQNNTSVSFETKSSRNGTVLPPKVTLRLTSVVEPAVLQEIELHNGRAVVIIGAPNRTLQPFEVPVTDERPVFDVAPAGGAVEILWSASATAPFTLTRNGIAIPIHALISWIFAHGRPIDDDTRLRVPDLAPGQYRACGATGQCADGQLVPGGMLELRVPE
jgi:hypothetical protein